MLQPTLERCWTQQQIDCFGRRTESSPEPLEWMEPEGLGEAITPVQVEGGGWGSCSMHSYCITLT